MVKVKDIKERFNCNAYIRLGNENDFYVYEDEFKTDIFDVIHYSPISK